MSKRVVIIKEHGKWKPGDRPDLWPSFAEELIEQGIARDENVLEKVVKVIKQKLE